MQSGSLYSGTVNHWPSPPLQLNTDFGLTRNIRSDNIAEYFTDNKARKKMLFTDVFVAFRFIFFLFFHSDNTYYYQFVRHLNFVTMNVICIVTLWPKYFHTYQAVIILILNRVYRFSIWKLRKLKVR